MSKRMRSELFRRSEQIHRMEPSEYPSDGSSSEVEVRTAKIWSRVKSRYGVSSSLPEMLQSQLKLRFINSPPPIIFTSSRIEANDGSLIAIELVDAATNTRVTLDSRLEIVALNADINEESWTTEEFNRNILRPREGKRPLLVGDLTVTLKEGVGVIDGDVAFTDNSCWLRSRKFRLGAKVTEGGVVEAISKAFVCKDHPGGSYRKHYPPYPDSEVWRLYKLTKNGVTESHLRKAGIHTVKDLRRHLAIHPNALPRELEGKISEKRWNAIVSHSMQCVLDKSECYLYKSEAHGASLLFNSVYEVMKVSFDGITVLNTTDLTSIQQALLDKLKREAYENRNSFLPVNDSDSVNFPLRTSKNLQDTELSIGYPGSPSIFEVERPEINSDSVSFPPRTSKNLQDAELSIGYPESPNIFEDERPEIIKLVTFSDTSDVFGTLSTHVASSTSKDYDVVIRYGRGDTSNNDFISHLRAALCRRGIYVHEDFDEVDAVPECRVLIIFLTSTYVPSNLLNILEHQRKKPRVVYPFFYGITPSDLISNCKNYERFFLQDEPKRWQAALKDIAQMRGYILTDKYVNPSF